MHPFCSAAATLVRACSASPRSSFAALLTPPAVRYFTESHEMQLNRTPGVWTVANLVKEVCCCVGASTAAATSVAFAANSDRPCRMQQLPPVALCASTCSPPPPACLQVCCLPSFLVLCVPLFHVLPCR